MEAPHRRKFPRPTGSLSKGSKVVSERAGHANVGETVAIYAAFPPNMQSEVGKKVDAWLA